MSRLRPFFFVCLFGFLSFGGGFSAQVLFAVKPSAAQDMRHLVTYFMSVVGPKGGKGVDTYVNDGQPGEVFYGEDGQMRIQIGTYNAAGERGLPLVGLSDNKGELRLLLRLAGGAESPVIVMKDNSGRDRIVLGLGFDANQDPFLSVTNHDGETKDVFGHYAGHP